jgi:glutamyl-tRNA reductase
MEWICVGLNHRTAPVEVRELFAVAPAKLGESACDLREKSGAEEAVVISTCNRTELYVVGDAQKIVPSLEAMLGGAEHCYGHRGFEAGVHLCRVASGLDSMVLGETEIFGQVKNAYQAALAAGATGGMLNKLFQKSFSIGKKVRTETGIQEGATSIGNVAVDLAEKIFGHLKHSEVMILGAGEISRVTAQSLQSRGARSIFVANRSYDRALDLASQMNGQAVRFDDWKQVLSQVDVVIGSTGAPHTIVHKEDVESVRRKRKYRPLFFIDIAVPRDIDPAVAEIEEVYLYDIDALEQIASEARVKRAKQIEVCETMIRDELHKAVSDMSAKRSEFVREADSKA